MPDKIVIADTSCLIILSKINQIEILRALYSEVIITAEIKIEFEEELPSWMKVMNPKDKDFQKALELQIDPGEASAIALYRDIPNCLLVLDDLKARKVAQFFSINYTGTLGILAKARQKGIIPELKPILNKILQTNFRIAPRVLHELLIRFGEADD